MTIKQYDRLRSDICSAIYRSKKVGITILMTSALFNELLTVFDIVEQEHSKYYYFLGYPVSCVVSDDSMKWWIAWESGEA